MTERLLIVAVAVGILAAATLLWQRRQGRFTEASGVFDPADLGLGRRGRVASTIVEFSGEHCAPCDVVRERLDRIAGELPDVRVVTIDAGQRLDLASRYGVRRVPTVFVADERLRIRWRASGVPTDREIRAVLLGPNWAGRPHANLAPTMEKPSA